MKQKVMALLLAWAMTVTLGCGLIDSLFGSGNAQRPTAMWSDVPQMEGMTQENMDLPLPLRLILQGLVQSAGAGEGIRVDNFQLLAFTSSSKSPADVKAFYTLERMRSAGWDSPEQIGCIEGTDQTTSNDVFCLFSKESNRQQRVAAGGDRHAGAKPGDYEHLLRALRRRAVAYAWLELSASRGDGCTRPWPRRRA
jgi:hypothetical protein